MTPDRLNRMYNAQSLKLAASVATLKKFDPAVSAKLKTAERHVLRLKAWFDTNWPVYVNFQRAYLEPFPARGLGRADYPQYLQEDGWLNMPQADYPFQCVVAETWRFRATIPTSMDLELGAANVTDQVIGLLTEECKKRFTLITKEWSDGGRRMYWRRRPAIIEFKEFDTDARTIELNLRCQVEGRNADRTLNWTDHSVPMRVLVSNINGKLTGALEDNPRHLHADSSAVQMSDGATLLSAWPAVLGGVPLQSIAQAQASANWKKPPICEVAYDEAIGRAFHGD